MKTLFTDVVDLVGRACPVFNDTKTYVNTGAVDKTIIIDDACETVCFEDKPSRANLSVESGSILFAKMKDTEKVLYIDDDLAENIYSTGFFAVKPKKEIIKEKSLYYLLLSDSFNSQKNKYSSGATQKAITNQGLKKIIINVPSLDEQNRLIATLDKLSVIILNYQQQLILLDKLIKSRFVEMFETTSLPSISLEECCTDILGGSTPSMKHPEYYGGSVPFIKSGDVKDWSLTHGSLWLTEKALEETTAKYVPAGSILVVNRSAALLREFHAAIAENPVVINQDIKAFIPKTEVLSKYLLWAIIMQTQLLLTKVTTVLTSHIDLKDLKALQIKMPSLETQLEFVAFVEQIDKSKSVIQKALDETQLLFDSLMQEYFG